MTVTDVLEYLAGGMTPEEIVEEFPDLTLQDIRACLAFAANPNAIISNSLELYKQRRIF